MKMHKYTLLLVSALLALGSCKDDDDKKVGNPTIESKTEFASAMFGDSLEFSIDVADQDVPLSTLKARLYFSDDLVSETVIRTKTDGNYKGKIYIPYEANVPNGTAKLSLVLQNINFTITEQSYDLALTRPDFPHLTLVTSDGEYKMERKALYEYAVTGAFPLKLKGYIKAPAMGAAGNEITFGWEENKITLNSEDNIPFSNDEEEEYSITFNTFSYEAAPFLVRYTINDEKLVRINDNNYYINQDLVQGQEITFDGIDGVEEWWIDSDFFATDDNGKVTFIPVSGKYKLTANFTNKYFIVEPLNSEDKFASLQADGTGAIWVIGTKVGKPSFKGNDIGWNPDMGLPMAYLGNKIYQISFVAEQTISRDVVDFKFFYQKGWGGEFKGSTGLTTTSDLIGVGMGDADTAGDGNIYLLKDERLRKGKTYVFTLDLSAGNDKAVLTLTEK